MMHAHLRRIFLSLLPSFSAAFLLSNCASTPLGQDRDNKMIVSVRDQRMLLVSHGKPVKTYKVSTSKFGLGDSPGSHRTPIGHLQVAKKIGGRSPYGAVFKSRRPTGEVIKPNAPGRDPIVTRILWLKGMEQRNRSTFRRTIYIHGTPEERRLGYPASYGCIRMSSRDIAELYDRVGYGADVFVIRGSLKTNPSNQRTAGSRTKRAANRG